MKLSAIQNRLTHIPTKKYPEAGRLICHFLDVTATATGRGSHYDSKAALQKATDEVHQAVFNLDRGIYGILLALPGVMDFSRQKGVRTLLGQPRDGRGLEQSLLTLPQETRVVTWLNDSLPIQRQLKLFGQMKKARINNSRTRRLILQTILNQPNLEWSVVKYRRKIEAALKHAWGERTVSIIRSILTKSVGIWPPPVNWSREEDAIIKSNILRWLEVDVHELVLLESLSFVLGNDGPWTLPKLQAYEAAKSRFQAGSELPPEVMEGIRSTYHPARSNADVMDLTKREVTVAQRIGMQKVARAKRVEIDFDPTKYDLVRLYVYAYEMGLDDKICHAIREKAALKGAALPMQFGHVGIVVDVSLSMTGHESQKHRPIATALAIRDVLQAASELSTVIYAGDFFGTYFLPVPTGNTSLAEAFLAVADTEPDSIFVVTDGYENAPAGRFAEVVDILREMGNDTPVYQLSPVMDATTYGTRNLSNDVPVLPINPKINIGMGLIKLALEQDFIRGLAALIESTDVLRLEG